MNVPKATTIIATVHITAVILITTVVSHCLKINLLAVLPWVIPGYLIWVALIFFIDFLILFIIS
jgi:hypothetical protein